MINQRDTNRPRHLLVSVLVLGIGLIVPSCNSSSPTEPDRVASANGSLTLKMVDLPTDEICQLWVYFAGLKVKREGESTQLEPLGVVPKAYDLLTLRDGAVAILGEFEITRGTYQFIEILLDESQSYVVEKTPAGDCGGADGEHVALQISSEKFKVKGGQFTVGTNTAVTIDFDADKSLKRKGSSKNPQGWQLKADVSIVGVS